MQSSNRPLSPHLSIYKPQITSTLSILHRASGFFLFIGLIILSWNVIFTVFSQAYLASFYTNLTHSFFTSIIGKFFLFFWTAALFYHFCNGIRHLVWDTGRGLDIRSATISGIIVITTSFILTIVAWFSGFNSLIN